MNNQSKEVVHLTKKEVDPDKLKDLVLRKIFPPYVQLRKKTKILNLRQVTRL